MSPHIPSILLTVPPLDRRLAQQTKLLKERNASLLRAVNSVKQNPSSSTVYVPGTSDGYARLLLSSLLYHTHIYSRNPVQAAYVASLESQISSLRDELATVYKTQGQNAQRLLAMNETLREKEELSRIDSEHLRKTRDEIAVLRRKVDQHNELMAEKDRTVQVRIAPLLVVRYALTSSLPLPILDPPRRDQHPPARARPDRGAQPNTHEGQRQAPPALA